MTVFVASAPLPEPEKPNRTKRDLLGKYLGPANSSGRKPGRHLVARADLTHVFSLPSEVRFDRFQGQRCKILKEQGMHAALVEFESGSRKIVPRRALHELPANGGSAT